MVGLAEEVWARKPSQHTEWESIPVIINHSSFMMEGCQNYLLPWGSWLVPAGKETLLRAQRTPACLPSVPPIAVPLSGSSLDLKRTTRLNTSIGSNQISLGEGEPVVLESFHRCPFVHEPREQLWAGEERLGDTEAVPSADHGAHGHILSQVLVSSISPIPPELPANLLATTHEFLQVYISGPFSFQAKQIIRRAVWGFFSYWGDFPSPRSWATSEEGCNAALVQF